ncbi:MAG: HEPN domain-containing protein [Sphaerochaeta sp.]
MRLNKDIIKMGKFWLATNSETIVIGKLSIRDGGKIKLEIFGDLHKIDHIFNNDIQPFRLCGLVDSLGDVTLDNCFYTKNNISNISNHELYVSKAYIGVLFEQDEEILFNSFIFKVEGIDKWVNIDGIKLIKEISPYDINSQNYNETIKISYNTPKTISINLEEGIILKIIFNAKQNYTKVNRIIKSAYISHETNFKLESKENKKSDEFISIAYKITNLLGFALNKEVCLLNIVATIKGFDREQLGINKGPIPIKMYYESRPFSKEKSKINSNDILFYFKDIQNRTELVFNNWLKAYDDINPTLNLYFSTKNGDYKIMEGRFLSLVQGLETFHRRTSDKKQLDEIEFTNLKKILLSSCPEKHKEFLSAKLQYANEVSLRTRIKDIIKPYSKYFGDNKNINIFINKIVETRNYLTHYDKSNKNNITSKGSELYKLCLKLDVIYQILLLQTLGFTKVEIDKILETNATMKKKLSIQ